MYISLYISKPPKDTTSALAQELPINKETIQGKGIQLQWLFFACIGLLTQKSS